MLCGPIVLSSQFIFLCPDDSLPRSTDGRHAAGVAKEARCLGGWPKQGTTTNPNLAEGLLPCCREICCIEMLWNTMVELMFLPFIYIQVHTTIYFLQTDMLHMYKHSIKTKEKQVEELEDLPDLPPPGAACSRCGRKYLQSALRFSTCNLRFRSRNAISTCAEANLWAWGSASHIHKQACRPKQVLLQISVITVSESCSCVKCVWSRRHFMVDCTVIAILFTLQHQHTITYRTWNRWTCASPMASSLSRLANQTSSKPSDFRAPWTTWTTGAPWSRQVLESGRCLAWIHVHVTRPTHGCHGCHGCHGYGHGALQPAPEGGGSRQPQACDATTSTPLHSWLFEFCSDDPTSNHIGWQPVRANLDQFGSSWWLSCFQPVVLINIDRYWSIGSTMLH